MTRLTKAERETIVRWAQDDSPAVIYTHDAKLMATMDAHGIGSTQDYVHGGQVIARSYELPRDRLRLRVLGPPKPRTEKQRAAAKRLSERRRDVDRAAATS